MPRYTDAQIAKHIKGCRGYIKVVSQRLGCSRNTIAKRIGESRVLQAIMEEELDRKGDDAEMLLEQMMSERVPIQVKRITVGKDGKQSVTYEERMVFSKAATPALIFFLRTKLRHRGYAQDNYGKPFDEKSIDESLREIAEAMMK